MVTHRCQYCDGDYRCDTMREVFEGVYRCECKAVDTCPGCSEHGACEECGQQPAIGAHENPWLCAECLHEYIDNYDGPAEPDYDAPSIAELSERAYRERAELRKRD